MCVQNGTILKRTSVVQKGGNSKMQHTIVEVNGTVRSTGVFLFNSLADENVTKYRINSAGDEMTEHFICRINKTFLT